MAHLHTPSVRRGLFLIAFAATAWAVGGFVAALLYRTSGLGPVAVSFWRFLGGVLLLSAIRPFTRRSPHPRRSPRTRHRSAAGRIVLTGLGFAIYQTAYYAAIQLTGLAIGTVVTLGAGPILIAAGGHLFLGERLSLKDTVPVALSLLGLIMLTQHSTTRGSLLGIGVALVSATGYAGVTLLRRAARTDHDPYDSVLAGFAVAALCVLPWAATQGLWPVREKIGQTLGLLAFLGAVPTALAYALFFAGLTAVRATTASVVALVEPLAAAILAVAVLRERLTPSAAIGGILLLAAITLLARQERRASVAGGVSTSR